MPIYEYACGKCGARFEYLAKSARDKAAKCVKCGAPKPVKQLSTFSAGHSDAGAGAESCDTGSCGSCAAAGSCPYDG